MKAGGCRCGGARATPRRARSSTHRRDTLRIPLPDKRVYDKLPPKEKESARILWNTVSAGYQPEMVRAWFACLYAYYESKPTACSRTPRSGW